MRRSAIEVKVVFLDVLAMIAFASSQSEQALFQDRIASIPQCQSEAQFLVSIADAEQPIFIPSISARAGVIVRKVIPRFAVRAVVFADGSPGAIADVRSPAFPVLRAVGGFVQAQLFFRHDDLFQLRLAMSATIWLSGSFARNSGGKFEAGA